MVSHKLLGGYVTSLQRKLSQCRELVDLDSLIRGRGWRCFEIVDDSCESATGWLMRIAERVLGWLKLGDLREMISPTASNLFVCKKVHHALVVLCERIKQEINIEFALAVASSGIDPDRLIPANIQPLAETDTHPDESTPANTQPLTVVGTHPDGEIVDNLIWLDGKTYKFTDTVREFLSLAIQAKTPTPWQKVCDKMGWRELLGSVNNRVREFNKRCPVEMNNAQRKIKLYVENGCLCWLWIDQSSTESST